MDVGSAVDGADAEAVGSVKPVESVEPVEWGPEFYFLAKKLWSKGYVRLRTADTSRTLNPPLPP